MEAETTLNRSYTYFHRKVREQRLMVVSCKSLFHQIFGQAGRLPHKKK
jgi:hypothetical protein